uniref:hypothetical protein n=1 Tax=Stenotrophomonas sp. GbtcB23 TaxID=2824768 RepID=UPI001C309C39
MKGSRLSKRGNGANVVRTLHLYTRLSQITFDLIDGSQDALVITVGPLDSNQHIGRQKIVLLETLDAVDKTTTGIEDSAGFILCEVEGLDRKVHILATLVSKRDVQVQIFVADHCFVELHPKVRFAQQLANASLDQLVVIILVCEITLNHPGEQL